jgi:mono/diheme cytochrome c family protein
MSKNSLQAVLNGKWKMENGKRKMRVLIFAFCLLPFAFATACRYDMQDQPRYKSYKKSEFFSDDKAMREPPEGTVARGELRENKAFYTGKKENINLNVQVETTIDATGNTLVSSFPNDIEEFPVPLTKELVDRGQERYNIYCIVCHGAVGKGDGMIVRRGYPQPPTYHDDRLRNAPVGHLYDVITNGWGKMNSYAAQVPPADRWAIVAYIRALQTSQNPDGNMTMTSNTNRSNTNAAATPQTQTPPTNANTNGGAR